MKSLLLYINPVVSERQKMAQLAADLVEVLTFERQNLSHQPKSIGIVAEPYVCLEISLSMLGRGEPRTVEGGQRKPSPLVLFPFFTASGLASGDAELMMRRPTEQDDYGTLNDLAAFGAIEQDPKESLERQGNQTVSAMLKIALMRPWECIAIFAPEESEFEQFRLWSPDNTKIFRLSDVQVEPEKVLGLLDRLEPIDDIEIRNVQKAAIFDALEFEALLSRLNNIS